MTLLRNASIWIRLKKKNTFQPCLKGFSKFGVYCGIMVLCNSNDNANAASDHYRQHQSHHHRHESTLIAAFLPTTTSLSCVCLIHCVWERKCFFFLSPVWWEIAGRCQVTLWLLQNVLRLVLLWEPPKAPNVFSLTAWKALLYSANFSRLKMQYLARKSTAERRRRRKRTNFQSLGPTLDLFDWKRNNISQCQRRPFVLCFLPPGSWRSPAWGPTCQCECREDLGQYFSAVVAAGSRREDNTGRGVHRESSRPWLEEPQGGEGSAAKNFSNQTQFSVLSVGKKLLDSRQAEEILFFFFAPLLSTSKVAEHWTENVRFGNYSGDEDNFNSS